MFKLQLFSGRFWHVVCGERLVPRGHVQVKRAHLLDVSHLSAELHFVAVLQFVDAVHLLAVSQFVDTVYFLDVSQ